MSYLRVLPLCCIAVVLLAVAGCGEDPAPGPVSMDADELESWEIALVEWRIEKNERFMDPDQSPLPEEVREDFEGLDYYFPVKEFRYELPLERAAEPDTVMLSLRKGEQVPYARAGTVRFRHGDADYELVVYASSGGGAGEERLFLPFYDLTNGETTYPGGRYLDLEVGADGLVELDFNKAYNPYCAYDAEGWNCTLPPPENRLALRVEAGEKLLTSVAH